MRKFLLLFLTLILLVQMPVSLAEGTDDGGVPHAEATIDLPDGYQPAGVTVNADGAILAAAKHDDGHWALITWTAPEAEPTITPLQVEGDIAAIDAAPDGNILVTLDMSMQDLEAEVATEETKAEAGMGTLSGGQERSFFGGDMKTTALWLAPDGTVEATLDIPGMSMQMKALDGRRMAVYAYQTGTTIYDETGAEVRTIDCGEVNALTTDGPNLYAVTLDGISAYDLETGALGESLALETSYAVKAAIAPDGQLYLSTSEGIYRADMGAQRLERVMAALGTLLGDPGNSSAALGVLADGTLVVFFGGTGGIISGRGITAVFAGGMGGESILAYYRPLDASVVESRTPFAITALYNSTRLRKAVSDFQRAHPELEVTLQIQAEDGDETPIADHIRTLNTDLLAGKGGDVLVLDGLPMDKYAQRGILTDLTALLPELGLLPNLAESSVSADGKTYAVPVQFTFQTLWGRSADVTGISTLEDLLAAAEAAGKEPLSARTPEDWLRLLYPASEASFRDENGQLHFNTPAFEGFLESLYELYSAQGELQELSFGGRAVMAAPVGRSGMNPMEMVSVYNGVTAFFPMEVTGLMQMSTAYSLAGAADGGFVSLPTASGKGMTYTPSLLVGIGAQSQQQEMAAEFIKTLYSADVQEADQFMNLPASQATLEKLIADAMDQEGVQMTARLMMSGGVELEIAQPDTATWEALEAMAKAVDTPAMEDETLMAFIIEETADFFEGLVPANVAAEALEQRAWFYLNE